MPLIYKTLFEVKLMHEFFLTDKDGNTIFEHADQKDRIDFLLNEFTLGRESINRDLSFEFPIKMQPAYDGLGIKLLSTYSGFKVAIRVKQNILPDNSLVYEPLIPLPDDSNIYIQVTKKNNEIDRYTNKLMASPLSSIYYFSNDNIPNPKTFPFITNPVSAFDTGYSYEQGELASFGANDIRENYKNDVGDLWEEVTGNDFANENDRLLVPLKFNYSFFNVNNITTAEFNLKDKNGNIIKTILVNNTEPIRKTVLDFSNESNQVIFPETSTLTDFIFSLEVRGSGGYLKNHPIVFSETLYNKSCWGIINIKNNPANSFFNLLANDGFLIKRKDPFGIWINAPVFEIPVKSRFTYWRYIHEKGKELKLIPALTDYLFKENKILMSRKPRAISKSYFLLQKEGSPDRIYVPNPISYEVKKDNKEREYFDIVVPESDLFPII